MIPLSADQRRLAVAVVIGAALAVLDASAVNVALGAIAEDTDVSNGDARWVLSVYLLGLAVAVPLAGWALKRFGGRRVWCVSLSIFGVGSLLCAAAPTLPALVVARAVQALGGGAIAPTAQSLLAGKAGRDQLGRLLGVLSVVSVLGPVIGPAVGGALTDAFDWRAIFVVNVPIVGAALVAARRVLPTEQGDRSASLDAIGLMLLWLALICLLGGATSTGEIPAWSQASLLVAGGLGLTGYVRRTTRSGGHGLLDLDVFKDRRFASAVLGLLLLGGALFGSLLLLPIALRREAGASDFGAGMLLGFQGLGIALAIRTAARLTDRRGPRAAILPGVTIGAIATLPFALLSLPLAGAAITLVVRGVGLGLTMTPLTAAAYATLPARAIPDASSITVLVRQLGGSLGTALAGRCAENTALGFLAAATVTALIAAPALSLTRPPTKGATT